MARLSTYTSAYQLNAFMQHKAITRGLRGSQLRQTAKNLKLSERDLTRYLGLPATAAQRTSLKPLESERLLRLQRLLGFLIGACGADKGQEAVAWFGDWICAPNPAFAGQCPSEFMDTAPGLEVIEQTIMSMLHGHAAQMKALFNAMTL